MEQALNTYSKGLNRDISKNKYSPETYFDALNVQIVSDEATSTLAVTNEKGNSFSFSIPQTQAVYKIEIVNPDTDAGLAGGGGTPMAFTLTINGVTKGLTSVTSTSYEALYNAMMLDASFGVYVTLGHYKIFNNYDHILVVGLDNLSSILPSNGLIVTNLVPQLTGGTIIAWKQLREGLAVLTTAVGSGSVVDAPQDTANNGQIWYVPINTDGSIDNLTAGALTPSVHLKYNNQLDFSTLYRPEIYANYESPEVGKIYWTDNNNKFRHFNLLDPNSLAVRLNSLEIVPDVDFGAITLNSVTDTGVYKSGMVQYSYQYYNLHGSQSAFAPPSGLVHLTDSSESLTNSQLYFGTARDKSAGKAVSLTITGIDKRFTNIRAVALFYSTKEGTPEITIIDDREVPSSADSITIVDSGNIAKGTVTSVEYTSLGSVNFKCKTIDVKDNIMFPANIEEDFFDIGSWDGRAYRCDINGQCVVKNAAGDSTTVNTTSFSLLSTHDAIQSKADQYTYKYLKDGSRLGGEGKNVKYYFKINSLLEDNFGQTSPKLGAPKDTGSFTNYASAIKHADLVGYQRDEVYRFGIVFRDARGRKSFVTWIADIKMPAIYETDFGYTFATTLAQGSNIFIRVLHPTFEVTNWPTGATSYEIVRVKRTEDNKTIKTQGLIFGVNTSNGSELWAQYNPVAGKYANTTLLLMTSPEINFYKKAYESSKIKPVARVHYHEIGSSTYKQFKLDDETVIDSFAAVDALDARVLAPGYEASYVINNNLPYHNYRRYTGLNAGYMGTVMAFGVPAALVVPTVPGVTNTFILANIEQELSAQYGGNSFSSRLGNQYISCNSIGKNVSAINVYGGDTFLGFFDYRYGVADLALPTDDPAYAPSAHAIYVVVESSINLALRHDVCTSKTTANNSHLMQETAGNWADVTDPTVVYPQTTDLYLYNTVYSRENDVTSYFSKPLNFSNNKTFDVRTLSSKVKTLNEEIDSWTSYLATNYIDIDGSYGPINKVITFNNRLYFYQNRAFGWFNVNERSLITPDASGSTLALGKGGVLDQAFYLSRYSGTRHQFSVIGSPNGLYSYDASNNKINLYNGEANASLSEVKGLGSLLKNFDNPLFRGTDTTLVDIGVHGIYDVRFNRVLFTFKDDSSSNELTVSYNEMLEAFEAFHSYKPTLYGTFDDKVFSINPADKNEAYLHNVGNRGEFYSSTYDSYITLLFNKDPHQIKLVTNLEYLLATYPDAAQNFKTVTIWNDYQTTGDITTTSDNSRRLMRRWRYTIPRDVTNPLSDARIRSEYVFTKLLYENVNDKKFLLFDLITHYIPRA